MQLLHIWPKSNHILAANTMHMHYHIYVPIVSTAAYHVMRYEINWKTCTAVGNG